MGGLGNQLFQYAFGRSLSIRSGRDLLLETGIISGDLYRNYALSAFNIQEQHVGTLNKRCTRWAGSNSTGKLFRALWPLPLDFVQDKENGFDPSIYNLKKGTCIFQGNWQSFKYFESCFRKL